MKITTTQILKILYILSWIIFVGVCIEAGAFIVNPIIMLAAGPVRAHDFWLEVDLSSLYQFDRGYFLVEMLLMSIVSVLRAVIFYWIVKILHDKKLDLYQPFNREVGRFISKIAYLSLLTGLFSWWGGKYAEWFVRQGVKMPDLRYLRLDEADVWLFMGVTLYILAQIFKRGIEIQTENDLTV
jgi:hypothetical protein